MKILPHWFAFLSLLVAVAGPVSAQQNRVSPTATIDTAIAAHRIKIVYARPYTKAPKSEEMRKIWDGLVPYGQVWRTGANEATMLTIDHALMMDGHRIPAGTYTLFSIPTATGGQLIINKQTGQWGTKYDAKQDLVRVPMQRHARDGEPLHQFLIEVVADNQGGGSINLVWEDAVYSTAFTFAD